MKCLNCGSELSEGAQFCKVCGAKAENTQKASSPGVICPHCGNILPAGTLYCTVCGKNIYGKQKKNNTGIIILASLAVLVTISCLVMLFLFIFGDLGKKEQPADDSSAVEVLPDDDKNTSADDDDKTSTEDDEDNDVWSPVDKSQIEDEDTDDTDDSEDYPDYNDYDVSDIYGLSRSEAGFMRNEIYARHGYIFKTEPYKSYFESQSWYHPNPNFSENLLSAEEKEKVNALINYEKQMGWR